MNLNTTRMVQHKMSRDVQKYVQYCRPARTRIIIMRVQSQLGSVVTIYVHDDERLLYSDNHYDNIVNHYINHRRRLVHRIVII